MRNAWLGMVVVGALVGCSSGKVGKPAPVEDRGASTGRVVAPVQATERPVTDVGTPTVPVLPGAENAGKPGYYTVKRGDTLIRIALESGQNWRDIARWNTLSNPNVIEVGQVLRVAPPGATPPEGASGARAVAPVVVGGATLPASNSSGSTPAAPSSTTSSAPTPAAVTAQSNAAAKPEASPPTAAADDDLGWAWPASGPIVGTFDEAKNKGLDIGGKAGDPVLAAADGRVVYSGSGLRGYGNLVILKHNNTFLSAYAHNQALLVKEDQSVRKGQKIAEMGSSDADRVKLHFEIRRQGKPVDPSRFLPGR